MYIFKLEKDTPARIMYQTHLDIQPRLPPFL